MAKPKITLFVDIVSPFAYMGFHALRVRTVSCTNTDSSDNIIIHCLAERRESVAQLIYALLSGLHS